MLILVDKTHDTLDTVKAQLRKKFGMAMASQCCIGMEFHK
jgi:hypothetical protein